MRDTLIILIFCGLIGCNSSLKTKSINTGQFEIDVPVSWEYIKERGIDSFIGKIKGNGVELNFDLSKFGYANHLIPTETEYIYETEYQWMPLAPYQKKGVYYTTGNVKGERERIMKSKGITDTSLVIVEPFQNPDILIIKENNQYSATLTYKDTIVRLNIEIPEKVKDHIFEIDTINNYKRKIVYPKSGKKGMTGVYMEDLNSSFNFNLVGENIDMNNQE